MFENPFPIKAYLFLVQNFFMSCRGDFGPNALTPTWSLAVEEQFYILIPFIVYFFSTRQIVVIALLFICGAQVFRIFSSNWYEEYTHLLSRIDTLFLGVLLAIARHSPNEYYLFFKRWYISLFLIITLIALYFLNNSVNHLLIATVFVYLLDAVIELRPDSIYWKFLNMKWILLFGKYSFFIYLFHQLINGLAFAIFQNGMDPNLNSICSYLIEFLAIVVTFLLAHFSFLLFESKIIKYSHRYKYSV
jgi:peptidoglycan/LPS O-acetylase OafA/YrhL